jgi:hypothetical protein
MTDEQIAPSAAMEGGGAYNGNAKLPMSGGAFGKWVEIARWADADEAATLIAAAKSSPNRPEFCSKT